MIPSAILALGHFGAIGKYHSGNYEYHFDTPVLVKKITHLDALASRWVCWLVGVVLLFVVILFIALLVAFLNAFYNVEIVTPLFIGFASTTHKA